MVTKMAGTELRRLEWRDRINALDFAQAVAGLHFEQAFLLIVGGDDRRKTRSDECLTGFGMQARARLMLDHQPGADPGLQHRRWRGYAVRVEIARVEVADGGTPSTDRPFVDGHRRDAMEIAACLLHLDAGGRCHQRACDAHDFGPRNARHVQLVGFHNGNFFMRCHCVTRVT